MSQSEQQAYEALQKAKEEHWERLCGHCGACCGVAEADPCEHLRQSANGKYHCSIYEHRFGEHKTVKGNTLICVPIRNILHTKWKGDECCGYKNQPKLPL